MDIVKQKYLYSVYFLVIVLILIFTFAFTDIVICDYLEHINANTYFTDEKKQYFEELFTAVFIAQGICTLFSVSMFIMVYVKMRGALGDRVFIVRTELGHLRVRRDRQHNNVGKP